MLLRYKGYNIVTGSSGLKLLLKNEDIRDDESFHEVLKRKKILLLGHISDVAEDKFPVNFYELAEQNKKNKHKKGVKKYRFALDVGDVGVFEVLGVDEVKLLKFKMVEIVDKVMDGTVFIENVNDLAELEGFTKV